MNVDNIIRQNKQFILILSGLKGSNKSQIAQNLNKLLHIKIIKYTCNNEEDKQYKKKFVELINQNKYDGLILIMPLYSKLINKINYDLHIHYFINYNIIKKIDKINSEKIINNYKNNLNMINNTNLINISNITLKDQLIETIKIIYSYILDFKNVNQQRYIQENNDYKNKNCEIFKDLNINLLSFFNLD
jgi:hypothetical protein